MQTKLQEQSLALAARMDSRDLSSANEEFNSFGKDMQSAAAAMTPSADRLKQMQWHDAIPAEQKALQYLLRAEATFRKIEVAFGQQRGGGGGNGGGAGRDLASLFDLELDTEKNQYETAQTGSAADQRAKAVDDALQKLDALARRQEELAQGQRNSRQTMQERWQQEMLRREAEQLQHQMEQLAQNNQQGQQGQKGSQGQQSAGSSSSSASSSGQNGQSQSSQAQAGADPRVTQALNRLRQADETMKHSAGQQQSAEAAKQAAEQLRQAEGLMSDAQQQQAGGKLDSLSRETDRLNKEEQAQADRVRSLAGQSGAGSQEQYAARLQQRNKLAEDRQQLSDDLSQLEKNLRNTARELAPTQPETSSKLRDALGGMDQSDLTNRVQRTADWLRRGVNPNSNGTEEGISKGLEQLSQQVHQAQQELGTGKPSPSQQGQGAQTAALDHVERFRDQVESLAAREQSQLGRGQQGQAQAGQEMRPGQGANRGQTGQPGQNGGPNQRAGNQVTQDGVSGDVGNRRPGGGAVGTAYNNINTGNNHFDRSGGLGAPDNSPVPADPEVTYRQGLAELNQLHHLAQNDPAALKEIQDLARAMQRLDPRRFPGNPALVEQLHTEVLSGVDKLELQLRHDTDAQGQVRATKEASVPPGYEEAVADYYRRLSKDQ